MKKRMILLLLLCFSVSSLLPRAQAQEELPTVELSAKSALLMERESGAVLYEENAHEQLAPASVTKVMTMLLTVEAIDSGSLRLDDMVTTSAYAAGMGGSQVYLEEGEQMSVGDMLKAVAVASGNDAAVALGEHLKGSEAAFVDAMNARAKELGMNDTHFVNCTGLPADGHVTSAYDIALMSRALLEHDTIRSYVGIWMDSLRGGEFQLANTNKLIHSYDGATGLKTGFTQDAGFCISASARRDGMELIAVILGSETSAKRFDSAKALLNYGFGGWAMADILPDEPIPAVPVQLGNAETVQPVLQQSGKVLLPKDQIGLLRTELTVLEEAEAPVAKGDELGTLRVYVGDELISQLPLTASEDVSRKSFGAIFRELISSMTQG